jgi:hypothetical protein
MKNIVKLTFTLLAISLIVSCTGDREIAPFKPVFFSQNFDGIENTGPGQYITLDGWSNVSINGGKKWEARTFGGEIFAQQSAFGSGESNMDSWLISPAIDFTQTSNETLVFDYLSGYNNGQAVSVLVSTDYDGSNTAAAINAATWTNLNVTLPDFLASGYPANFSHSAAIDLSGFNGNGYIAFRYTGSTTGTTSTYEIDNIKLYENK